MSSTIKIQKRRMATFLDFLNGKKSCRVLEVGCQSGIFCHELMQRGHEPYGMDIAEELIADARIKYPRLKFELGDCEKKFPFEDKYFDVVLAGDIIEHIHYTDTFVNEVNRVLKISGLFILTTPMHNRLKNLFICLFNFEKHFDPEFPHLRFYTLTSLRRVLQKRGFRIISRKYIGRISLIANSMFVVAEKVEDKKVLSEHRF